MVKTNEQTLKVPWFLAIIASHKQAIIASYYGMYLTFFKSTADNGAFVEVHRIYTAIVYLPRLLRLTLSSFVSDILMVNYGKDEWQSAIANMVFNAL